jgi:hypothetical protein
MADSLKLVYRTARSVFTYVMRLCSYMTLILGGVAALAAPPDTIIDSLGRPIIVVMAYLLLIGASAAFFGWLIGRWEFEQYGAVVAAAGAGLYFWATTLSPDVVTLGGGLRLSLTLYVGLSLVLRVFELERYTSISVISPRIRLESR